MEKRIKSTFNNVFKTFNDWKTKIIDPINTLEKNPAWLNDNTFKYTQEDIFDQLKEQYGNYRHNLRTDEIFLITMKNTFMDEMIDFYIKVQQFEKLEVDKITEEFFITYAKGKTTQENNVKNKSENKASSTPTGHNIGETEEALNNMPLNSITRGAMENIAKGNVDALNFIINRYDNYKTIRSAKIRNNVNKFKNAFSPIFRQIKNNSEDIRFDEYVRFSDDTIVSEVPYLCEDNYQEIELNKTQINTLYNHIQTINSVIRKVWIVDKVTGVGAWVFMKDLPIEYFDGLTKTQIIGLIAAVSLSWQSDIAYKKDILVNYIDEAGDKKILKKYLSLINNNLNNNPKTSPAAWEYIPSLDFDITDLYPYIDDEIRTQLQNILNTFDAIDVTDVAWVNEENEFTEINTFKESPKVPDTPIHVDFDPNIQTNATNSRSVRNYIKLLGLEIFAKEYVFVNDSGAPARLSAVTTGREGPDKLGIVNVFVKTEDAHGQENWIPWLVESYIMALPTIIFSTTKMPVINPNSNIRIYIQSFMGTINEQTQLTAVWAAA